MSERQRANSEREARAPRGTSGEPASEQASELNRKPLWARKVPLDLEDAATRTTAYVYGNILVLAALVTQKSDDVYSGRAFWIVIGTAVSTFLAHVFAEGLGGLTRHPANDPVTWRGAIALARESWPVLTSGLLPAALLVLGWTEIIGAGLSLVLAEAVVLIRIAGTGIIVARLRNEPSSLRIILLGVAVAGVAALISLLKVYLTH